MFIGKPKDIRDSQVTDHKDYLNRREFLKRAAILTGTAVATGTAYRLLNSHPRYSIAGQPQGGHPLPTTIPSTEPSSIAADLRITDKVTPFDAATHYNNFYEFSTGKEAVADLAAGFVTKPWSVEVKGLVRKPQTFDLDDLFKISHPEERTYRMRCVEAWSMVIPWDGFSLSRLLDKVQPLSSATYVAFETLVDRKQMPGLDSAGLNWPYVEGLRIDEAMHPLTILASGMYGRKLPPQDGAPVRLVVPWKYGFKGIKSIVKITLTDDQPPTTWNIASPDEYGFYANVNPNVPHPRWGQDQERRIDGTGEHNQPTLMFNGYGDSVAALYSGMDLRVYF